MSPKASESWGVHATVDEPIQTLCAFVAHYLSIGAEEVHLYLDRPTDEAVDILGTVPGVRLTLCDAAYWAKSSKRRRPAYHIGRQAFNANAAYREAGFDWLLFCDADEFVHGPTRISEVLADQSQDVDFLRIPVAERVFELAHPPTTIFDGVFRKGVGSPIAWRDRLSGMLSSQWNLVSSIYGLHSRFFDRGMLSHDQGKSIARTGRNLHIDLHFPWPSGISLAQKSILGTAPYRRFVPDAHLLHFDAMTPTQWALKLLRKYVARVAATPPGQVMDFGKLPKPRARQAHAVYNRRQSAVQLASLARVLFVDPKQIVSLRRNNALVKDGPDIVASARALFPTLDLDFSIAAFDADWRATNAELIERTGFTMDDFATLLRRYATP